MEVMNKTLHNGNLLTIMVIWYMKIMPIRCKKLLDIVHWYPQVLPYFFGHNHMLYTEHKHQGVLNPVTFYVVSLYLSWVHSISTLYVVDPTFKDKFAQYTRLLIWIVRFISWASIWFECPYRPFMQSFGQTWVWLIDLYYVFLASMAKYGHEYESINSTHQVLNSYSNFNPSKGPQRPHVEQRNICQYFHVFEIDAKMCIRLQNFKNDLHGSNIAKIRALIFLIS